MSHRPVIAFTAALAAGVAFIPGSAHAAGPSSAGGVKGATASSAFRGAKTFSSPATTSAGARKASRATPHAAAASGMVIYTDSDSCLSEGGRNGTSTAPYCNIQDAVNAAVAGDTVDVLHTGTTATGTVTVTTSNISIVSTGAWIDTSIANPGTPALVLKDVTGVKISNLMLSAMESPALEVIASSDVTIDSSVVGMLPSSWTSVVTIDGFSSGVTISRTYVGVDGWTAGDLGVQIDPGASDITLASDLIADNNIQATDVKGLNVVGTTIQRSCASGIDIKGTSTGVSLENNLIDDSQDDVSSQSYCASKGDNSWYAWGPDVAVATGSVAGTTADYNDFSYGADTTTLYSGVAKGPHDAVDTKQPTAIIMRNDRLFSINAGLVPGSAAIGSANTSAPGALSSDFYGMSPYTSRGAVQYLGLNPTMSVSLTGSQTSAYGIAVLAGVTSSSTSLTMVTDWGDGTTTTSSPEPGNSTTTNQVTHSYAKLGIYPVTVTVSDGQGDTVANTMQVETDGAKYTAYGPTRVLDTRKGIGTGGTKTAVPAGGTIKLKIGGAGTAIPADVSAVALNLTVTDAASNGYITAYPDGIARPSTSNVNFLAGQTLANMAIVTVGADGYIDLRNTGAGSVDLVADASGYYTPDSTADGYTPVGPSRFLDTHTATVSAANPAKIKIEGVKIPGTDTTLSGVDAVAVNVTVADPSSSGYIAAYPDGTEPTASNVNFTAGQVLANAAIVPVGSDGSIDLAFTGSGATRLVVDVDGYYSAKGASVYAPSAPFRALDTRAKGGLGALHGGGYDWVGLAEDSSGADIPSITGVLSNTTVTQTTGSGYLVVFPDNGAKGTRPVTVPTTSTLNFLANQTVANLTFASPGTDGAVDYDNAGGSSLQLVVDVFGYFMTS